MKITFLKLIIFVFGGFAVSRVFLRYKGKELSLLGFTFWTFIWVAIFAGSIFPGISEKLAELIGVGRGVDSAFFTAIILLFYLIFRLYIKLDKVDKDLTRLTTEISKKIHKNKLN